MKRALVITGTALVLIGIFLGVTFSTNSLMFSNTSSSVPEVSTTSTIVETTTTTVVTPPTTTTPPAVTAPSKDPEIQELRTEVSQLDVRKKDKVVSPTTVMATSTSTTTRPTTTTTQGPQLAPASP